MKYLLVIFAFLIFPTDVKYPREIPTDLKTMDIVDFFEPDEISRVWRYPDGGAAFEELFEIRQTENSWTAYRYTYLLDEYITDDRLQLLRKKQKLNLSEKEIMDFVNEKLLHKDTKSTETKNGVISDICFCDLYRTEYRKGDQAHFFEFYLEEKGNTNISKLKLITFLNKIVLQ